MRKNASHFHTLENCHTRYDRRRRNFERAFRLSGRVRREREMNWQHENDNNQTLDVVVEMSKINEAINERFPN